MGLKITNLCKKFGGKVAVDNISFEMNKPGVYGLLGTNGAGKTTTIRMILGILNIDFGDITWNGKQVTRESVNFGYLPEERGVYPKTKVIDQLIYFAMLKGMSKAEAIEKIDYWLEKLKVTEYRNMEAEKLSKGNQQKIQFITAVVHNPELIILDEPFSGLDPVNTNMLKSVILELIEQGKYIIMSSHQMASIEEFCTDILILNKGKTVIQGNLKEIKNNYPAKTLVLNTKENIDELILSQNFKIKSAKANDYIINIDSEENGYKFFNYLAQQNINVIKFELVKPSLHDIFVEKVG